MTELTVIVPSRGRPAAARALAQAFAETCTADTRLLIAVDSDEPEIEAYKLDHANLPGGVPHWFAGSDLVVCQSNNMVQALNQAAEWSLRTLEPYAIAFCGDDHRPRTMGWDSAYLAALRDMGTGIVYGDDLLQRANLPTQCAMTSDIVRALGYICPLTLRHMYVDNFWKDLGQAAGCLRYLPNVVVEHVHPVSGKVDWDEGHRRVNAPAVYQRDEHAYNTYKRKQFQADVDKVKALRPARPAGVHEWRLFDEGTIPEYTTPEWYATREAAPHLEQEGHRERLMHTASQIARELMSGPSTLVDLGAGDGGLLSLMGPGVKAWGYDLQPANLLAAKRRGVDVRFGDVLNDEIEWGRIAVATEMLEHLIDPHSFVKHIRDHAEILVCSSPRLENADSHYEFHTWAFDAVGYRAMVENAGWTVKRQSAVGAFQVVVAAR